MSVNPVTMELSNTASSKQILKVTNDTALSMPVEFKIYRIDIDEAGKEIPTPADPDFTIYPPTASIGPGKVQSFQVRWAGKKQLTTSQTYRISVNQLPVKSPESESGMQLVVQYLTVAHVSPVGSRGTLDLLSSSIGRDEKGVSRPRVLVENKGTRHVSLADASVTLSAANWSQTLSPAQLRQIVGLAIVLPGRKRQFTLPINLPQGVQSVKAQIDYQNITASTEPN
jgi:fimbrial chaperone protein